MLLKQRVNLTPLEEVELGLRTKRYSLEHTAGVATAAGLWVTLSGLQLWRQVTADTCRSAATCKLSTIGVQTLRRQVVVQAPGFQESCARESPAQRIRSPRLTSFYLYAFSNAPSKRLTM
jgi:hypothetical protein